MSNVMREAIRSTGGQEKIYAKTDEAKAILKKMAAKAADIRSQKTELSQLSSATETCWKGLSGDALREKLAALMKEQEAIAKDLEQDTQAMTSTLQEFEDEDRALAASFGSGSSGGGYGGGSRHG